MLATLKGFLITHVLGQRAGEKRANEVSRELAARITVIEKSLSRDISAVDRRLDDFRMETKDRLGTLEFSTTEYDLS